MEKTNLKELKIDSYPLKSYDKIRYRDTDRQGHVNNSLFSTFIETGRIEFLYHPDHHLAIGSNYVIAHINMDFIDEIKWPGNIEIGTAVTKVGNSSIHLAQGLYQDSKIVATAQTVIVQVDAQTKKSKALTQENKTFLESLNLIK